MPGGKGRTDWDKYFLDLARQAASRSSCTQHQHGAVIVANRHIRSTGYNGTPSGYLNCDEGGCPRGRSGDPSDPCWGLHAEANAILYANPEQREGATIYVTAPPCLDCAKLISNSGLREVVAPHRDGDGLNDAKELLLDCKVRVRLLKNL
ncbi:MAG: dCMP deaminase family protein [Actinomycetota bacterium]|nr:dCMP deaminase family protein [Actinomycetota bacterium]